MNVKELMFIKSKYEVSKNSGIELNRIVNIALKLMKKHADLLDPREG